VIGTLVVDGRAVTFGTARRGLGGLRPRLYWLLYFLCPVTDISATVVPISVKFCMMVHIGPGQISAYFGGGTPGIPKSKMLGLHFGHLSVNVSKTVSRSDGVTCQLELNVSSTRVFQKCKSRGSSPPPGECTPVWRVGLAALVLIWICFCNFLVSSTSVKFE